MGGSKEDGSGLERRQDQQQGAHQIQTLFPGLIFLQGLMWTLTSHQAGAHPSSLGLTLGQGGKCSEAENSLWKIHAASLHLCTGIQRGWSRSGNKSGPLKACKTHSNSILKERVVILSDLIKSWSVMWYIFTTPFK